ncbi:alpha/beta fold hydrolase [Silvanigrella paludirubra]|jgi:alpha-beta hydrolase superfamily lysophospholipase|uniref:Alpha/beta fold hydrolase n=1 Tax=Silvanigrella paludirubra TaxID=2499159 RepID=A0A6N6VSF0_9BACT|nr:alpha/beta fold hydrolase [Silvanigrella paludirubra]KAB8036775.1 alpha/beta fold hydrolase [Silvanigrella paludirubra]
MFQERAENIKSFDGNELFFRVYTPAKKDFSESKLDGVVLAVHGFGEHSGRYPHVAKAVCAKNLAFAIFDIRGHGKSGPSRGDAENLHAMVLDVIFMTNHVKQLLGLTKQKNSFFGLMGHSFGSLLVTYAAAHLADSCPPIFLSSPCYGVKQSIPAWKRFLADKVAKFLPQIVAPIGIPPENLSNNDENNNAAREDSLILKMITARMGNTFLGAVEEKKIIQAIRLISAPVTIVAAADDKLVRLDVTKKCVPYFSHNDSTFKVIQGAGHEIFNETEQFRSQALSDLIQWTEKRN